MEKKRGRKLRLPNGFGSIVTQKGKRRTPYIAYTKTTGYDDKGHPIRKILGFFETWEDAYDCLLEYNKNPYDIDSRKITFKQFYELFIERRKSAGIGKANASSLQSAFRRCPCLHERKMCEIKTLELQAVLDDLMDEYKHASLESNKSLWVQMWEMAVELDMCQKNYAKYVNINKANDDEHGIPFTREEIDKLWLAVDNVPDVDMILVMIYSGFRVSAYKTLKIDMDALTFTGGVKTESAKNRVVPIHSRIVPLVERLIASKRLFGQSPFEIRSIIKPTLFRAGVAPQNHTPHDCRHTLATELNNAEVQTEDIKRILGHSIQDITHGIYIHADIERLRAELEKMK